MRIQQKLWLFAAALLAAPTLLIVLMFRVLYYRLSFAISNRGEEGSLFQIIFNNYYVLLFLFFFICIILTVFMSVYFVKSILRPVTQLTKAAEEIEKGNLDYEIRYAKNDEFRALFDQFERMQLRIKDLLWEQVEQEKTRTELIASIAHDLKTPITSIQGYAQALEEGIAQTKEKQDRYLQIIVQKTQDLDRMADSLYLYSRLELQQMQFEMESVNVPFLVEELQEENFLTQPDVEFTCSINVNKSASIYIDLGQFRRVFANIVSNSIKYKRKDTVALHLSVYENEQDIIFAFEDDGIGVSSEHVQQIFTQFYRTDSARQNAGNSSGLGLSISKKIIESFFGKIWAQPNHPHGLRVYISLPKRKYTDS